jgi:uroporphyrinogen III methyltransferase/synthase
MRGKVYLVGGGCGPADLMTLRGLRLLQSCEVLVWDDLLAPELAAAAPETAEKIYAGKRLGRRAMAQEDIHALLIDRARAGKRVVRLKGGDPFLFGRGGEEAQALNQAGIPWEAVPGVSSALAIPAEAGIPVTHRGVSRSVHIVTAHAAGTAEELPEGLEELARLPGTLVFLMGLSRLPRLARGLTEAGMDPRTPAAVISGGNAPCPMTVRGTLADIGERAAAVRPPAVIVVGGTAGMDLLADRTAGERGPLKGTLVGLTGTGAMGEKLSRLFRDLGAETVTVQRSWAEPLPADLSELAGSPTGGEGFPRAPEGISARENRGTAKLPTAWNQPPQAPDPNAAQKKWVAFTSGNGVRLFFRAFSGQGFDLRQLASCRFAVIGAATGAALREYGFHADLCPETFTGEALALALLEAAEPGEPIWLVRSQQGGEALRRVLAPCRDLRELPLYRLRSAPERIAREQLETLDYLAFSSASGVEFYFQAYGTVPDRTVCVCIGETTAAALKRRYRRPFLTAPSISDQGVAEAVRRHRKSQEKTGP